MFLVYFALLYTLNLFIQAKVYWPEIQPNRTSVDIKTFQPLTVAQSLSLHCFLLSDEEWIKDGRARKLGTIMNVSM